MASRSAALVEGVAQALSRAISDPTGHSSWCRDIGAAAAPTRRRGDPRTKKAAALVFDSSAIPPISIENYLLRLFSTFRCSDATFIAALILVDRLLDCDGGRLPLTMRNVHRVFLASLVVAAKYHEDLVYSNSHYARAGGVHLREVNRLERVLLGAVDFDLRVEPDEYQLYEAALLPPAGPEAPPPPAAESGAGPPQKPARPPAPAEPPRPPPRGEAGQKEAPATVPALDAAVPTPPAAPAAGCGGAVKIIAASKCAVHTAEALGRPSGGRRRGGRAAEAGVRAKGRHAGAFAPRGGAEEGLAGGRAARARASQRLPGGAQSLGAEERDADHGDAALWHPACNSFEREVGSVGHLAWA